MASINIKSKKEIEIMRKGGKIAATILLDLKKAIKPGLKTKDLANSAEKLIEKEGAKASFKNYNGYPSSICVSINDEVVHGIPSDRIIKEGDIIGLDVGIFYGGYHADTAITVGVGKISPEAKRLILVTEYALQKGIQAIRPNKRLGEIQNIIQYEIEKEGFGVVRDLVGHGIGKKLQESPAIPNFGSPKDGPILKEGMTLAIEPMVTAGDWRVKVLDDGWTVTTIDKSLSAHFEHTIAVTKNGAEVLTKIN